MFTGIVAEKGTVVAAERTAKGLRVAVRSRVLRSVKRGESVCVAGCCLTISQARKGVVVFEVVPETLRKTGFSRLRAGDAVNLERALRHGERVSGHFVQGHVDGVGTVEAVQRGKDYRVTVRAPKEVARFLLPKGSVAVDGVSLTIAKLGKRSGQRGQRGQGVFEVALIPETLRRTTLAGLRAGDRVHLEADVLGKYLVKLLKARPRKEAMHNALAGRFAGGSEPGTMTGRGTRRRRF